MTTDVTNKQTYQVHYCQPANVSQLEVGESMETPRRVTLLIGRNGSVQLLPDDDEEETGGGGGGGGSGGLVALLALTFTCGLALNIAVTLTVAVEPTLRKALFLRCLATLAFANALDCALNVTIASIAITSWAALSARSASQLCRVSAITSQMSVLAQTSAVWAIVLERAVAVGMTSSATGDAPAAAARVASVVSAALVWYAWPSAIVLASAPAVMAPVRIFPNRYGCGIAGPPGPALWLTVTTLVIGFLIPWVCMAVVLASSVRHVTRRRWRRQQLELAAQRRAASTAQAPPPSQAPPSLWFTSDDSLPTGIGWNIGSAQLSLAVVLLFLYITLLSPQILTTLTFQLVRVPVKRLPPTSSQLWPANTGAYETVFVWLRFQFAIVSPGLILIFHKEVRQRVERLLSCLCRSCYCRCGRIGPKNSVTHAAIETQRSADVQTPVLFASDQGLFLRVTDHMFDSPDEASSRVGIASAWAERDDPRYVFQFCDVALLDDKTSAAGQLRPLLEEDVLPVDKTSSREGRGSTDFNRKNVRFASFVNEIPSEEVVTWSEPEEPMLPRPMVTPPTDSPVKWLVRSKRTSLEMELVSEDPYAKLVRRAPPSSSSSSGVASSVPSTPRVVNSSTFSLPPGKTLFPRTSHV